MVMVLTNAPDEVPLDDLSEDLASSGPALPRDPARKCLATGEVRPKAELIRFVLGPDKAFVPDLAARLPGRGLWVSASRAALEIAIQKNLFTRAARTHVKADVTLIDQVEQLLAKRCLELLGLARSAGLVVLGQPQVEQAVKAHALAFVLVAADAGKDGVKKLHHATLVPTPFTRDQLGAALGRDHLVSIGLKPHSLTEKLKTELARWRGVGGSRFEAGG